MKFANVLLLAVITVSAAASIFAQEQYDAIPQGVEALRQSASSKTEFTLDHSIARATLRICGLGFYEAYINGQRVGDQVLDPPPTVYNDTALYAAFDVSDLVRPGANAIGVMLGRGYFGATASDGFNLGFAPWRNEPRLLLQLDS